MASSTDLVKVTRSLQGRLDDLKRELDRLTEPPPEGSTVSFGKRIGDGTTEAVERITTTATARSISATVKEIERALQKIEEGTYGVCDSCGQSIAPDRQEARPATPLCLNCAAHA